MSSYTNKTIQCKCCGFNYKTKILRGFFNSVVADLDTYAHSSVIFDRVVKCPNCGYSTEQMNAEVDEEVIAIVYSEDYQAIVKDVTLSDVYKKNYLCAFLHEFKHEYKEAALHYLRAYWITREEDNICQDLLVKVVDNMKCYLTSNMDISSALIMIDCMRQMSCFDEAEETAKSLNCYLRNDYDKKLILFELDLIKNRDNKPHSQSEVVS